MKRALFIILILGSLLVGTLTLLKQPNRIIKITELAQGGYNPVFSPDGRSLVFTRSNGSIYLTKLDNAQEILLTSDSSIRPFVQWLSLEQILYVKQQNNNVDLGQFWIIDIETRQENPLQDEKGTPIYTFVDSTFELSPSNAQLAYTGYLQLEEARRIHILNLSSKSISYIPTPTELDCLNPTWSPNEQWVLYKCVEPDKFNPIQQVWLTDLTSGVSEMLTDAGGYGSFSWSPNNHWLAFTIHDKCGLLNLGCSELWLAPVKNNKPSLEEAFSLYVKGTSGLVSYSSWSPDGESISFASNNESKNHAIYIWVVKVQSQ
jgi:Tol biopolymer transport system component